MNRTQIAALYDSMTPEEQNMSRVEFIRQVMDTLDPVKMAADADVIARGRIQKAQIDAAIKESR